VTRSRIGQSVELGIDRASEESPGEPDAAVEQSLTVSVRIGRRPADE
jgi:hypothetical protein